MLHVCHGNLPRPKCTMISHLILKLDRVHLKLLWLLKVYSPISEKGVLYKWWVFTQEILVSNFSWIVQTVWKHEEITYMCCVLSGISWKSGALIVRYSQKKELISFVFYCLENPSIGHNLGTTGPIRVGFSAKCTSPNEHFNQIVKWKCHMLGFRQISDHITYCNCLSILLWEL